ncbi:hypothetical protein HOC32_00440, partial [Candidatus Woesearchaeota archaeon]|nr:hypothetical protein [Candidatus Woesearchaeota archaeon]
MLSIYEMLELEDRANGFLVRGKKPERDDFGTSNFDFAVTALKSAVEIAVDCCPGNDFYLSCLSEAAEELIATNGDHAKLAGFALFGALADYTIEKYL